METLKYTALKKPNLLKIDRQNVKTEYKSWQIF